MDYDKLADLFDGRRELGDDKRKPEDKPKQDIGPPGEIPGAVHKVLPAVVPDM